jgi:hypothetical protein
VKIFLRFLRFSDICHPPGLSKCFPGRVTKALIFQDHYQYPRIVNSLLPPIQSILHGESQCCWSRVGTNGLENVAGPIRQHSLNDVGLHTAERMTVRMSLGASIVKGRRLEVMDRCRANLAGIWLEGEKPEFTNVKSELYCWSPFRFPVHLLKRAQFDLQGRKGPLNYEHHFGDPGFYDSLMEIRHPAKRERKSSRTWMIRKRY